MTTEQEERMIAALEGIADAATSVRLVILGAGVGCVCVAIGALGMAIFS